MEREGFDLPLLIGGATTSRVHTAVKIHPHYARGQAVYVTDASRAVGVRRELLSPEAKAAVRRDDRAEYRKVADAHARAEADKQRLPLAEGARQRAEDRLGRLRAAEADLHRHARVRDLRPRRARRYIDWTPFFQTWELKGRFPAILEDEKQGAAARQLYDDAQAMLRQIVEERWFNPKAVIGFWPANAVGDDIRLFTGESRAEDARHVPRLRQQLSQARRRPNLALADFVAPEDRASRLCRRLRGDRRHRGGRDRRALRARQRRLLARSWSRRWPTASPRPSPSACTSASARSSGATRRTRTSPPRS